MADGTASLYGQLNPQRRLSKTAAIPDQSFLEGRNAKIYLEVLTMETPTTELSLGQKFSLKPFTDQVGHMSREQAQEFLLKLHEHMMLKENMYKSLLKHEWGLDSSPMSV